MPAIILNLSTGFAEFPSTFSQNHSHIFSDNLKQDFGLTNGQTDGWTGHPHVEVIRAFSATNFMTFTEANEDVLRLFSLHFGPTERLLETEISTIY